MSMSKVMSNDRAAEKLAQLLMNYYSGKGWEKELATVLQAFAVKYHELSPEFHLGACSNDLDAEDHPSTLWHQFFVRSLGKMLNDLPPNVNELKEKPYALEREQAEAKEPFSNANKRRHINDNKGRNVRTLGAGSKKLVKVDGLTKLTVSLAGLSTLRGFQTGQNVNGGLDVLEFTFENSTMVAARLDPASNDIIANDGDVDLTSKQ